MSDNLTPAKFVDDILLACDTSNWNSDMNTDDYCRGMKDACKDIEKIAVEYQIAMYDATKRLAQSSIDDTANFRMERIDILLKELRNATNAAGDAKG